MVGGIRLHSGYIALAAILVQAIPGGVVKRYFKKPVLMVHRFTGLALVITVTIHVILVNT